MLRLFSVGGFVQLRSRAYRRDRIEVALAKWRKVESRSLRAWQSIARLSQLVDDPAPFAVLFQLVGEPEGPIQRASILSFSRRCATGFRSCPLSLPARTARGEAPALI